MIKHIDHALVAKSHPPEYMMHKYWARKPHNVVSEYIKSYSTEGEIVLDPFVGSGVTAIESIKLNRKAVSIDLNPMSGFIINNTLIPADDKELKDSFYDLELNIKEKINSLYIFKCPECKKPNALLNRSVWSYSVRCPYCKKEVIMFETKHAKDKKQSIYNCTNCKKEFNYALLEIKRISRNG